MDIRHVYCSGCGDKNIDGLNYCSKCGTALSSHAEASQQAGVPSEVYGSLEQSPTTVSVGQNAGAPVRRTSGMAIASLVLGVLGLMFIPVIGSILAIVFGAVAMKQIDRDPGLDGRGLAIAGLVMGIVGVLLCGFLFLLVMPLMIF